MPMFWKFFAILVAFLLTGVWYLSGLPLPSSDQEVAFLGAIVAVSVLIALLLWLVRSLWKENRELTRQVRELTALLERP